MAPKKKQKSGNAYFYFMQDFKKRPGFSFRSMQELSEAASPHWEVRKLSVYLLW